MADIRGPRRAPALTLGGDLRAGLATSVRTRLGDDQGIAMVLVVGVMSVLFLLATMLFVTARYMTHASVVQEDHVKAVHVADAGLNAYLQRLHRNQLATGTLGPTIQDDGRWLVTATSATPTSPLTLRSQGCLAGQTTSVTVVATVRFPTFADYMFLSNADINIGAEAVIQGKVRSNGNINNLGHINGSALAVGRITGQITPAFIRGGAFPNQPIVDFAQVTADMDSIRAAATAVGTCYPKSGGLGYRATFNGADKTFTLERVTGGTATGILTCSAIPTATNVPIPACGVVYFLDDVYIQGAYGAPVTVCGNQDIFVISNYGPVDINSTVTGGLVAQRNIVVPTWYPSVPENMVLTSALLAQSGTVYGDVAHTPAKTSITITGSSSYFTYGYFASGSPVTAGFRSRTYNYDQRLDLCPPPRYPVVHDGSLKVNTWIEE